MEKHIRTGLLEKKECGVYEVILPNKNGTPTAFYHWFSRQIRMQNMMQVCHFFESGPLFDAESWYFKLRWLPADCAGLFDLFRSFCRARRLPFVSPVVPRVAGHKKPNIHYSHAPQKIFLAMPPTLRQDFEREFGDAFHACSISANAKICYETDLLNIEELERLFGEIDSFFKRVYLPFGQIDAHSGRCGND